jgi:hypothetical protein
MGAKSIDDLVMSHCRNAQHEVRNYILFERFQFELPPDLNGIILRAGWHRPGGCQPIPKSELPP